MSRSRFSSKKTFQSEFFYQFGFSVCHAKHIQQTLCFEPQAGWRLDAFSSCWYQLSRVFSVMEIRMLCNDKLSPCRYFVIDLWRYLQHGYVPGTGSHDHRPILPPSGKSCPNRGGFRLVWSTRRLESLSFITIGSVNYTFALKLPLRKPLKMWMGTKINSRSRFHSEISSSRAKNSNNLVIYCITRMAR